MKLCEILDISSDYILTGTRSQDDISAAARNLSRLSERDFKLMALLIERMANEK
jgi:hypothetical protein